MSAHVCICNSYYSCQRKMECLPSAVDRTDVSDVDRMDRLHQQSTFCPIHCAARDAAPGRGTSGSHIVHSLGHMGVVVSIRHGWCCSQGLRDVYTLRHPWGESQPTTLSGRLLSFPMHPTFACHSCPSSHVRCWGFVCTCIYQ